MSIRMFAVMVAGVVLCAACEDSGSSISAAQPASTAGPRDVIAVEPEIEEAFGTTQSLAIIEQRCVRDGGVTITPDAQLPQTEKVQSCRCLSQALAAHFTASDLQSLAEIVQATPSGKLLGHPTVLAVGRSCLRS